MSAAQDERTSILFVDDEPMVLNALRRELRKSGYELLFAGSGAEALEILAEENIDVVVSDMRMPEMSGAQLLRQVRDQYPEVISLLLSGQADMKDTMAAINEGGIFRFLAKPWQPEQLKQSLDEAAELRAVRKERDRLLLLTRKQNKMLIRMNQGLSSKLNQSTAELGQIEAMVEASYAEMQNSIQAFVRMFSFVVSARHGMQAGTLERAAKLSLKLGELLQLPPTELTTLEQGVLLSEVGKIRISETLLTKSEANLTLPERAEYQQYPVFGHDLLLSISYLQDAAIIVRQHRETFNGRGFPARLRGKAMAPLARVASVAIDYYALQGGARIQARLNEEQVLAYLSSRAGQLYDPEVVALLPQALEQLAKDESQYHPSLQSVDQLLVGDRITRNLLSRDGFLLLSAGVVLNQQMIQKLKEISRNHDEKYVLHIDVAVRQQLLATSEKPS